MVKSAAIYANAFQQNREFYSFYRSLNAYRGMFNSGSDMVVLEPDSSSSATSKIPRVDADTLSGSAMSLCGMIFGRWRWSW